MLIGHVYHSWCLYPTSSVVGAMKGLQILALNAMMGEMYERQGLPSPIAASSGPHWELPWDALCELLILRYSKHTGTALLKLLIYIYLNKGGQIMMAKPTETADLSWWKLTDCELAAGRLPGTELDPLNLGNCCVGGLFVGPQTVGQGFIPGVWTDFWNSVPMVEYFDNSFFF